LRDIKTHKFSLTTNDFGLLGAETIGHNSFALDID
jgi:hypothetical protein